MAIHFRGVSDPPLTDITFDAPDRSLTGILGLDGSGQSTLLRLAAGVEQPVSGQVEGPAERRLIGAGGALDFSPVGVLCIDYALANVDAFARATAIIALERLRRIGATVLIASHDEALLTRVCDEIVWLEAGRIAAKGDPRDVALKFRAAVARQLAEECRRMEIPLDAGNRRGDGRAELLSIETASDDGVSSLVLLNGALSMIRVRVRYLAPVENPVIGIMIRTRIGLEVYGTNTELERAPVGSCVAGDEVCLEFRFSCGLCPGEYTVTAASHDPDGTAHDWLDDAIAFSVAADRYTAGVADLRAHVTVARKGAASRG